MVTIALTLCCVAAPAIAREGTSGLQMKAPQGFEDMSGRRQLLVSLYLGGQERGRALVVVEGEQLRFTQPEEVVAALPNILDPTALRQSLKEPLKTNVALACGILRIKGCGSLASQTIEVILDEDRLRLDLFLPSQWFEQPAAQADQRLPSPTNPMGLVSLVGLNVSGTGSSRPSLFAQSRTVASAGPVRLVTDVAGGTDAGFAVDQAALETEKNDWRFTAGAFWSPISDLLGRRRILGVGAATQLDTRADQMAAASTPLPIFLAYTSLVEVVLAGRIVASRTYAPGNHFVDTGSLPDGAYEVELRIRQNGVTRTETRFFSRGGDLAPPSRPLISLAAGFLEGSGRLAPSFENPITKFGVRLRAQDRLGVEAQLITVADKVLLQSGATLNTRAVRVRLAGIVSSKGDAGMVLQAAAVSRGPISANLEVRHLRSGSATPIVPVTRVTQTFGTDGRIGLSAAPEITLAVGAASYRLSRANLRVVGHFRQENAGASKYGIAAFVDWPISLTRGLPLWLQGEVSRSERETAIRLSARFVRGIGPWFVAGSAGLRHASSHRRQNANFIGEAQIGRSGQLTANMPYQVDAAVGIDSDGSYGRINSQLATPSLHVRGDALHQFGSVSQYSAALNTGFAISGAGAGFSGEKLNASGVRVSIDADKSQSFKVVIGEQVRGVVRGGSSATFFVEPFRTYGVKLVSMDGSLFESASGEKTITVYPGNVVPLHWAPAKVFVLFTQAVSSNGQPIANAYVKGAYGEVIASDAGYFQIETVEGEELTVQSKSLTCRIEVRNAVLTALLWAPKELQCRRISHDSI